MIRAVYPQDIEQVWPVIEGWVEDAMQYTDLLIAEDVLEAIKDSRMQCLVVGDPIVGVVVTEIAEYPRKKVLRVVALGGNQFDLWVGEMNDVLCKWAAEIGAKLESTGRKGWERRLAPLGWKAESVTVGMNVGA